MCVICSLDDGNSPILWNLIYTLSALEASIGACSDTPTKYSNKIKLVYVWCYVLTTSHLSAPINKLNILLKHLHIYSQMDRAVPSFRSVMECEKSPQRPVSWPGSCTPRWCAPALRRLRSSGPSACLSLAPGSGRSWRGGSTAPCTEGPQLAGLEQNPLAALAWETLLRTSNYIYFILNSPTLLRWRTYRVTSNRITGYTYASMRDL